MTPPLSNLSLCYIHVALKMHHLVYSSTPTGSEGHKQLALSAHTPIDERFRLLAETMEILWIFVAAARGLRISCFEPPVKDTTSTELYRTLGPHLSVCYYHQIDMDNQTEFAESTGSTSLSHNATLPPVNSAELRRSPKASSIGQTSHLETEDNDFFR